MKKNIVFFKVWLLISVGFASSMMGAKTSVKLKSALAETEKRCLPTVLKDFVGSTRKSLAAHPYRTVAALAGISLVVYVVWLYRTNRISCQQLKDFWVKFCPCKKKKVDGAKKA